MDTRTEKTIVVFRKWPKKEGAGVLAIFPNIPGTDNPYTCSSFEHVGQHGACDPQGLVMRTRPAKPEEYADLKRELESAPYDYVLEVHKRLPSDAVEKRRLILQDMFKRA